LIQLKPSVATLLVRTGAEASCPENPVDVAPLEPLAPFALPLSEPPQAASARAAMQALCRMRFDHHVILPTSVNTGVKELPF